MEFRAALGGRIYGCDDCQEVCPVNRTGDRHHPHRPPRPEPRPAVDLLGLLAASDDDLLAAHGRWYMAERDPRYLRRNALVALGNVGDGRDPATTAPSTAGHGATTRSWPSTPGGPPTGSAGRTRGGPGGNGG